jgi:hypothetical protein
MYFPKFWNRGTGKAGDVQVEAWGWSDSSETEAASLAASRAQRLAQSIASGERGKGYLYGTNPLREPVLERLEFGIVSRNGYGCEVLNSESVLFCDIDFDDKQTAQPSGILSKLFGGKPAASPEQQALDKVRGWIEHHTDWGIQAYRTKAGLRLIATHDVFDPVANTCDQFFDAVAADPHFRRLCKVQKSFRARLTPKPWRCGTTVPPARWPFRDQQQQRAFEAWKQGYDAAAARNAVCTKLEHLGSSHINPQVQAALAFHDSRTKAGSGLPLA